MNNSAQSLVLFILFRTVLRPQKDEMGYDTVCFIQRLLLGNNVHFDVRTVLFSIAQAARSTVHMAVIVPRIYSDSAQTGKTGGALAHLVGARRGYNLFDCRQYLAGQSASSDPVLLATAL